MGQLVTATELRTRLTREQGAPRARTHRRQWPHAANDWWAHRCRAWGKGPAGLCACKINHCMLRSSWWSATAQSRPNSSNRAASWAALQPFSGSAAWGSSTRGMRCSNRPWAARLRWNWRAACLARRGLADLGAMPNLQPRLGHRPRAGGCGCYASGIQGLGTLVLERLRSTCACFHRATSMSSGKVKTASRC